MPRLALLVVLLLVLAGCTAEGQPTAAAPGPSPAVRDAPASSAPADALTFRATTVQGDAFDAGDYAGQDLMVWFWAPW